VASAPDGFRPSGARVVLAVGRVVVGAGVLVVAVSFAARASARQETAGIGLALVMGGLLVVLLGNYLRHASGRATGAAQPSSVPTTDTNDTISPG